MSPTVLLGPPSALSLQGGGPDFHDPLLAAGPTVRSERLTVSAAAVLSKPRGWLKV